MSVHVKKFSRIIAFILIVAVLFVGMGLTYKNVVKNVNLGLDLQGGFEVLYQVKPLDGDKKSMKKPCNLLLELWKTVLTC